MVKLSYVLWTPGPADLRLTRALLDQDAPRLLASGARRLTVNVADVAVTGGPVMPRPRAEGSVAALVSAWLDRLEDRSAVEAILRPRGTKLAGYLVTESIPRDFDRRPWADGERTPGIKQVTFFDSLPRMAHEAFIRQWHGSHTPLSLEVHPLWRYVRNVVERPVTDGAPRWLGIVEETFRQVEDFTDPQRMYGSVENMRRVLADVRKFIDLDTIEVYVMSEYAIRS
jgi:hypothetical protein